MQYTAYWADARRNSEGGVREPCVLYSVCCLPFRLVAVPEREHSLARVLKPVNLRYARYVNRIQGWCGRLWQERFYSCPMDPGHTLVAVRYVERNPVRAGMVPLAEDYPWSSAAGHAGRKVGSLLSDRQSLRSGSDNWSDWQKADADTVRVSRQKLYPSTGRPLVSEAFAQMVEVKPGRELRPKPHGRPRRQRS